MFFNIHNVTSSYFPLFFSFHIFSLMLSVVIMMKTGEALYFYVNIIFLLFLVMMWFKDVMEESFSGYHNKMVNSGFFIGFKVFIMTETMFFFGVFWYYFDKYIFVNFKVEFKDIIFSDSVPLINTFLLIFSGVISTWVHNKILMKSYMINYLYIVIILGTYFLFLQFFEYSSMEFDFSDGILGSVFYFLTGFHGSHVLVGLVLLLLGIMRYSINSYSVNSNLYIECSIIYWHFVDVIWLLLFFLIYL